MDSRFGFAIAMPKRFEILPDTIDPLARMMRGLYELSEEEAAERQSRLPMGFFDPEVLGDLGDGDMQPLRLFEYEAIRGRDEPLSEEQSQQMWLDIQGFMPETLASGQMPGYEFLWTRDDPRRAPGAGLRVQLGRRAAGPLRRRPRLHRVGAGADDHLPRVPPLLRRRVGRAPARVRGDPRHVRGVPADAGRGEAPEGAAPEGAR